MRADHNRGSLRRHLALIAVAWKRALTAGLLLLTPAAALAQTAADPGTVVSVAEARQLGLIAIREGRPDLAAQVARALLAGNANDPYAHFLLANAMLDQNRLPEAAQAGKLAYRHAGSPEQSYQSARIAALASYQQGHFSQAQWWLRKAAHNAPDQKRLAQSVAEFAAVRQQNPFSYDLRFSAAPSDNVNNGSSGPLSLIDGVPVVGLLSADAQALSGLNVRVGASLSYRLARTPRSETALRISADVKKVTLSQAAKASLGTVPAPKLDTRKLEFALQRTYLPQQSPYRLSYGASVGRQWQSGITPESFAKLSAGVARAISPETMVSLTLSGETRSKPAGRTKGDDVLSASGSFVHALPGDGTVRGSLYASRYLTEASGRSSDTLGLVVSYLPAPQFSMLQWSVSAGAQTAQFDGYSLAGIAVPGGRSDASAFAELELLFPQLDYSGFAPSLALRHQISNSNVSRFDSRETSVSLSVKSLF